VDAKPNILWYLGTSTARGRKVNCNLEISRSRRLSGSTVGKCLGPGYDQWIMDRRKSRSIITSLGFASTRVRPPRKSGSISGRVTSSRVVSTGLRTFLDFFMVSSLKGCFLVFTVANDVNTDVVQEIISSKEPCLCWCVTSCLSGLEILMSHFHENIVSMVSSLLVVCRLVSRPSSLFHPRLGTGRWRVSGEGFAPSRLKTCLSYATLAAVMASSWTRAASMSRSRSATVRPDNRLVVRWAFALTWLTVALQCLQNRHCRAS